MDMNRTFFLKKENRSDVWRKVDAKGKTVGRLATEIADALRGKDKAHFTPHTDSGDYVVVVNARHVVLTGDKLQQKEYVRYTGWEGGQKKLTAEQLMERRPEDILRFAVKGMMPKTKLARQQMKKLKIYADEQHPHAGQTTAPKEKKVAPKKPAKKRPAVSKAKAPAKKAAPKKAKSTVKKA